MSIFRDRYGFFRPWLVFVIAGVILFTVVGGLVVGIRAVSLSQDRQYCANFAQKTGRATTFVQYTDWSWDCLTPGTDGKLISIDALRDVVS